MGGEGKRGESEQRKELEGGDWKYPTPAAFAQLAVEIPRQAGRKSERSRRREICPA